MDDPVLISREEALGKPLEKLVKAIGKIPTGLLRVTPPCLITVTYWLQQGERTAAVLSPGYFRADLPQGPKWPGFSLKVHRWLDGLDVVAHISEESVEDSRLSSVHLPGAHFTLYLKSLVLDKKELIDVRTGESYVRDKVERKP
ncbi:MAG TPA: hypothetical protein VJK52_06405 [Candidatus Nanoarchaeia archaeon]|nr:hypothetical protein [Candidatus Nanoarchaeia archaeon]